MVRGPFSSASSSLLLRLERPPFITFICSLWIKDHQQSSTSTPFLPFFARDTIIITSSSLWSALFPLDYNCCCYCVLLLLLPRSARSFAAAATSFLISFAWTSEPNVESSSIFFLAVLFAAVCRCYYSWRCCCYVTNVLQLFYLLDVPSPLTSFMFRVTTCIEQHHHRPSLMLPLLFVVDVLLLSIFSIICIVLLSTPVHCCCSVFADAALMVAALSSIVVSPPLAIRWTLPPWNQALRSVEEAQLGQPSPVGSISLQGR